MDLQVLLGNPQPKSKRLAKKLKKRRMKKKGKTVSKRRRKKLKVSHVSKKHRKKHKKVTHKKHKRRVKHKKNPTRLYHITKSIRGGRIKHKKRQIAVGANESDIKAISSQIHKLQTKFDFLKKRKSFASPTFKGRMSFNKKMALIGKNIQKLKALKGKSEDSRVRLLETAKALKDAGEIINLEEAGTVDVSGSDVKVTKIMRKARKKKAKKAKAKKEGVTVAKKKRRKKKSRKASAKKVKHVKKSRKKSKRKSRKARKASVKKHSAPKKKRRSKKAKARKSGKKRAKRISIGTRVRGVFQKISNPFGGQMDQVLQKWFGHAGKEVLTLGVGGLLHGASQGLVKLPVVGAYIAKLRALPVVGENAIPLLAGVLALKLSEQKFVPSQAKGAVSLVGKGLVAAAVVTIAKNSAHLIPVIGTMGSINYSPNMSGPPQLGRMGIYPTLQGPPQLGRGMGDIDLTPDFKGVNFVPPGGSPNYGELPRVRTSPLGGEQYAETTPADFGGPDYGDSSLDEDDAEDSCG